MNIIFHDLIIAQVITIYIDNTLVFTKTIKKHQQVIVKVMQILFDNDLFLKLSKCQFEKDKVKYLGFIISTDHIAMDLMKIDSISTWPTPIFLKESFLEFGNFYHWFIHDFTILACPLNNLTKKDILFV